MQAQTPVEKDQVQAQLQTQLQALPPAEEVQLDSPVTFSDAELLELYSQYPYWNQLPTENQQQQLSLYAPGEQQALKKRKQMTPRHYEQLARAREVKKQKRQQQTQVVTTPPQPTPIPQEVPHTEVKEVIEVEPKSVEKPVHSSEGWKMNPEVASILKLVVIAGAIYLTKVLTPPSRPDDQHKPESDNPLFKLLTED